MILDIDRKIDVFFCPLRDGTDFPVMQEEI